MRLGRPLALPISPQTTPPPTPQARLSRAPAGARPATPTRTPGWPRRASKTRVSTQASLKDRDRGEHQDSKERQQYRDRCRQQHMVQRAPALSDQLAPLSASQIGRKGADALAGSGAVVTAGGQDRGQAAQSGDLVLVGVVDQPSLERRRAGDLRRDEHATKIDRKLALDLDAH